MVVKDLTENLAGLTVIVTMNKRLEAEMEISDNMDMEKEMKLDKEMKVKVEVAVEEVVLIDF